MILHIYLIDYTWEAVIPLTPRVNLFIFDNLSHIPFKGPKRKINRIHLCLKRSVYKDLRIRRHIHFVLSQWPFCYFPIIRFDFCVISWNMILSPIFMTNHTFLDIRRRGLLGTAGVPFLSVPRATSSPYSLQRVFGRATTGTVRGPLCDTHLSGSCSLYYRGVRSLYNTLSPFKGHFRQAEAWCRASIRITHRKGVILW